MERPRVHNGATNDDGTELDVRCAYFTLMLAVQPHTLKSMGVTRPQTPQLHRINPINCDSQPIR